MFDFLKDTFFCLTCDFGLGQKVRMKDFKIEIKSMKKGDKIDEIKISKQSKRN
jgi:hypothetical protein